jgi:hypothetical protein
MQLAFLAPKIVEVIAAGRQPPELTAEALTERIDVPLLWTQDLMLAHSRAGFHHAGLRSMQLTLSGLISGWSRSWDSCTPTPSSVARAQRRLDPRMLWRAID